MNNQDSDEEIHSSLPPEEEWKPGCSCCGLFYNFKESDCYANIDWIKRRNDIIKNKLIPRLQSDIINYHKEINENNTSISRFETHLLNQFSKSKK